MGRVISQVDISEYSKKCKEVEEYLAEEQKQEESLQNSESFKFVYFAKKYDDWFLDPLVGFFLPAIGDILSSLAITPALYVSIFKLHSIKLFLAIIYGGILDLLVGVIPVVGDFIDACYKSNKIAARLLVGYVEKDEETIEEINKRAVYCVLLIVVTIILLYTCYKIIMSIYHWFADLIPSIF